MLAAAYELFCERGYAATTMTAIAEQAKVAVQTLYFTFNTKAALLAEVMPAAVLGFELWPGPIPPSADAGTLLDMHPWFAAFRAEPDARRALQLFIAGAMGPLSRVAPLTAAVHAAESEPAVRTANELGERWRQESWRAVLRMVSAKAGGLRAELALTRAADIMLVVLGSDTLYRLYQRGWTDQQARRWFEDVLAQQLLGGE